MGQRIALCVADGMGADTIAVALGVTEEALRAEFAHELQNGRAIVRAQQLETLSKAGTAASAKALLAVARRAGPADNGAPQSRLSTTERALRILKGGKE